MLQQKITLSIITGILILAGFGLFQEVQAVSTGTGAADPNGDFTLKSNVADTCGLTNENLYVSVENPTTDNYFDGPTVVEVKICDSDIADTTVSKGEPDVTVNGRILRMVQATDGNWYGYFAERSEAQTVDAISNPDFGTFCDGSSNLSDVSNNSVTFDDTVGIAVNGHMDGSVDGTNTISGNICSGTVLSLISNALLTFPMLNTDTNVIPGQIGISPDNWPVIQLYDFQLTENVAV